MRRVSLLLGTLLIVSLLLTACGGEETSTTVPSTAESTMTEAATAETPEGTDLTTTPEVPVTGAENPSRLSYLLDLDVWNQNNEQIGEVEDMVLDMDASNISYVVIETGGFLDIGDKTVLIPWESLDLQTTAEGATETSFILTIDQELLNNAPDIDLSSVLPGRGEPAEDWDLDIRNFWDTGVVPGATQEGATTQTSDATATVEATAMPEMTATTSSGIGSGPGTATGQGAAEKLQGVMLASELLGATLTISQGEGQGMGQITAEPAATADTSTTPVATDSTATASPGTDSGTGSDAQGPTSATIEDAIVDPDSGDILYLVLNTLFDDGERWIPVPLSTLRWDMTNESFQFVANANALMNAPFFQADQFPDTSTEGWDTDFNDFWQKSGSTTP